MKDRTTEIVWVFGSSAAGKETFIRHVTEKKPSYLLELMGWKGRNLVPCEEGMAYIAQYDGDPLGKKRGELLEIIPRLAQNHNSVILIKGQDLDLRANRLMKIKRLLPSLVHKIVFLHTDMVTIFDRVQKKRWWKPGYDIAELKKWLQKQVEKIRVLEDEFEVIGLESSNLENYTRISFPVKE